MFENSAMNSVPLSKMTSCGQGYLVSQVCSTKLVMTSAHLVLGTLCISNQPVAGSIIVMHQRIRSVFPFLLILYGPIMSTHSFSQRRLFAFFSGISGKCPYFFFVFLVSWHVWHVEHSFWMCSCILDHVKC